MNLLPVSIHYSRIVHRNLTHVKGHPHLDQWKAMGRQYKQKWHGLVSDQPDQRPEYSGDGQSGDGNRPGVKLRSCRAQVIRSVSDWSHGVLTEHSIQDACVCFFLILNDVRRFTWVYLDIQLIREANHYIYIGMFQRYYFLDLDLFAMALIRKPVLVRSGAFYLFRFC